MLLWKILMEQIDFSFLEELAAKYGTPYYLMYPDVYEKNIGSFLSAFTPRYENIIVGYSFKTNYVPYLCGISLRMGCYAEVVSTMEYELARYLGFEHIIFNGPIKNKPILIDALKNGTIVNLDSLYEVDCICEYKLSHPNDDVRIGLRVNIELTDEMGSSRIQNGLRVGRFGFTLKMLEIVIRRLKQANVNIISIHGHTSSSDRAVSNYQIIVRQMLKICKTFDLEDIEYFDIGGGFFGAAAKGIDASHKPQYKDYADAILDIVLADNWFITHAPAVVIEPGVSVVANVFSYVSKLYQSKRIAGQNFITTDGTVFDVKPTMHSNNLPFTIYTQTESTQLIICDIVGSTCMEKDIILKDVEVPKIQFGDYILIDGVGAYTITLTPTFINYLSPILSLTENTVQQVRRRQTINDIISLYK